MRIILDCDLMRYRDSGLYHYCLNLGMYVKNILDQEQKDDILFYVPPSEARTFPFKNSTIIEKKWHANALRPFLWNCDIWHAPFQTGRLIPRTNKNIRILLTIHDLNVLHEDKSQKERVNSLRKTQKLIDGSDAVVCISNHTYQDVIKNLNVAGKPVYIIHNGTHWTSKTPNGKVRFRPSKPFIFSLGYVNRKKNFHTLLSLVKNKEVELIIAGRLDEPNYVESIMKQAYAEGIEDRVHILGPVSEEDKAWYFENSMAFMMPSLAEGFGAPVVEAMSYGKPIFLSSRTSLPEIGGDVSFYFSDFDPAHMLKVFDDGMSKYKSENLKNRIIERGKKFNWEEKAREYIQVYRSLLDRNS